MFKSLMYDKVVEVLNDNTQSTKFKGGYVIALYGQGIPHVVDSSNVTSVFDYKREIVIPVSEEYFTETPSVNKSDRSDYVAQYQILFQVSRETEVMTVMDEFREYFFTNKQFELDGYTVAIKTTRGDKQPAVMVDSGDFYVRFKVNVYLTAVKYGYIKKTTDTWGMALSSGFGNVTVATSLVVGTAYEIDSLGTTDWNVVYGTEDITYSIGDSGLCVEVGTGTGEGATTYQELTLIEDTLSTVGNPIFSNATEKGKGYITTTTLNDQLNVVYNDTTIENKIYDWCMNYLDKDTEFKMIHNFNGREYTYDAVISSGGRTLKDNGMVIMSIGWIEVD